MAKITFMQAAGIFALIALVVHQFNDRYRHERLVDRIEALEQSRK